MRRVHRHEEVVSFRPTIPATIAAMLMSQDALTGSPNSRIPSSTVPTAPIPTQML